MTMIAPGGDHEAATVFATSARICFSFGVSMKPSACMAAPFTATRPPNSMLHRALTVTKLRPVVVRI
jgi:hypothetical protein